MLTVPRSSSPTSLNYVSANFPAAPRSPLYASMSAESLADTKPSKCRQFRARAKKIRTTVKKGFKTVACLYTRGGLSSKASTLNALERRGSTMSVLRSTRPNTPGFCVTHPTYRGSNKRLTVHEVPPTPGFRDDWGSPVDEDIGSSSNEKNKKSMRFSHPVVSGVIANGVASMAHGFESRESLAEDKRPSTPTTDAALEFENQVNPIRLHKSLSGKRSFNTFKNILDGAKPKPVSASTLPYISVTSEIDLDAHDKPDKTHLAALAAEVQDQYLLQATNNMPASLVIAGPAPDHPSTLLPGTAQPAAPPKPRTTTPRPHTTPNYLPFMAFEPGFDPYNEGSSNVAGPSPSPNYEGKGKGKGKIPVGRQASNSSLSAASAEASEAEARRLHNRHTTLYDDVEGDFSFRPAPAYKPHSAAAAPAPAPAAPKHKSALPPASSAYTPYRPQQQQQPRQQQSSLKRKAVPAPVATTTASASTSAPQRSKRTPSKKAAEAAAAAQTSKPLPGLPSLLDPRRYTQNVVPEGLRMTENGYPVMGKMPEEPRKTKADAGGSEAERSRRMKTARAVESALEKLMF